MSLSKQKAWLNSEVQAHLTNCQGLGSDVVVGFILSLAKWHGESVMLEQQRPSLVAFLEKIEGITERAGDCPSEPFEELLSVKSFIYVILTRAGNGLKRGVLAMYPGLCHLGEDELACGIEK